MTGKKPFLRHRSGHLHDEVDEQHRELLFQAPEANLTPSPPDADGAFFPLKPLSAPPHLAVISGTSIDLSGK